MRKAGNSFERISASRRPTLRSLRTKDADALRGPKIKRRLPSLNEGSEDQRESGIAQRPVARPDRRPSPTRTGKPSIARCLPSLYDCAHPPSVVSAGGSGMSVRFTDLLLE